MMNLLPIENLIIYNLDGGSANLFTPDSPAKHFYLTLLQQLDNREGVPTEAKLEGTTLSSHHQAQLLPFKPPQSRESSSSEGFDPLFQLIHLTLLHPLNTPIPAETGGVEPSHKPPTENGGLDKVPPLFFVEKGKWNRSLNQLNRPSAAINNLSDRQPSSEICSITSFTAFPTKETLKFQISPFREAQLLIKEHLPTMPLLVETPENIVTNATGSYSYMSQPSDLIHQKPLSSQGLKEDIGRYGSMPTEVEETGFDQSMIKGFLPGSSPGEINRTSPRLEDISSPFHLKRDDSGGLLGASRFEKTEQGSSFLNPTPLPFNRSVLDQPFPLEWKDQTIVRPSLSPAKLDGEERLSSMNLSRFSDFSLSQNEAISPGQNNPVPLRGETTAQPIDSSRVGFFERVGQAIAWSIQKGAEKIAVRLEPPELGTLFIKLEKNKEVLKATFWAEHQTTKELLEIHRQDLRRILEADGFKLERFDVYVEQETDRFLEERSFSFLERRPGDGHLKEDTALRTSDPLEARSIENRRHLKEGHYIDRII